MSSSSPASSSPHRPVAVITGGTRGIGLAIARDLAPSHHLVVGGRSRDSVDAGAVGIAVMLEAVSKAWEEAGQRA